MEEQKKQFPTPAMLKAKEEWAKKTPQEREAIENRLKEKFRKYYANRPSREHIQGTIGENQDEYEGYLRIEVTSTEEEQPEYSVKKAQKLLKAWTLPLLWLTSICLKE